MNKVVLLLLFAILAFSLFAEAKSSCRILRLKNGNVVKRCKTNSAVTQRLCKVIRAKGRVVQVCCRGKVTVVRRRKGKKVVPKVKCPKVKKCTGKGKARKCRKVKACYAIVRKPRNKIQGPRHCKSGQILRFKRVGLTIYRWCVKKKKTNEKPLPDAVCWSTGDPHFKSVDGKNFDQYAPGDYLLAKTADGIFEVHSRQYDAARWRGKAVNRAVAVRVNGLDIVSLDAKDMSVKINHVKKTIAVGKTVFLKHGGAIKRLKDNQYEVLSPNGARLVGDLNKVDAKNFYLNAYVYVTGSLAKKITGFCKGKTVTKRVAGLFRKVKLGKIVKVSVRKWKKGEKAKATRFCRARGFKGVVLRNCIFDFRVGGKFLARASKGIRKITKKIRKVPRKLIRSVRRGFHHVIKRKVVVGKKVVRRF